MSTWKHGKTVAGATTYGLVSILEATGVIGAEIAGVLKGLAASLFGIGVRHAIEKQK